MLPTHHLFGLQDGLSISLFGKNKFFRIFQLSLKMERPVLKTTWSDCCFEAAAHRSLMKCEQKKTRQDEN